jgi:acyl-CoA synthetase (NDP forming)
MSVYTEEGDTIVGDVLVGEARKVSKPVVIVKTGRHKAQRIVLREDAKCRIEKKLRFIG